MEKLFDNSDYKAERYTCGCFYHVMDVSVEKLKDDMKEISFSTFPIDDRESWSIFERIKVAFKILFKKKYYIWEFCFKEEDVDSLIKLLEWSKK